jgi:Na+/phosphate symporter
MTMKKKITNTSATREMELLVSLLGEMFHEVSNAFTKHRLSLKYENTMEEAAKQIRKSLVDLSEAATEMGGNEALSVQATAMHLSKIFYDLLRLSTQVETKVKEKVMFSDEAAGEIVNVFDRTAGLLGHVSDALRTCNELIIAHVKKEVDELRNAASGSTTMHEDRLCKGKCHPKASMVYLQMMQHLQDALWHFKALVCDNGMPLL